QYSVAFYTASIVVALLLTKDRKIFLNKHLYLSAAVALLIMFPNILWQYNHNFPLIAHMEELKEEQLQFNNPLDFLTDQLMMFLPCVFIWLAGLYFTAFTSEGKPYRTVAFTYLFVIALLTYMNGKSYYAAGAYPVLFAFGAFYLEKITTTKAKFLRYVFCSDTCCIRLFNYAFVITHNEATGTGQLV
ncbi:unnamed protein product, partial [marine sediment metagenome]